MWVDIELGSREMSASYIEESDRMDSLLETLAEGDRLTLRASEIDIDRK